MQFVQNKLVRNGQLNLLGGAIFITVCCIIVSPILLWPQFKLLWASILIVGIVFLRKFNSKKSPETKYIHSFGCGTKYIFPFFASRTTNYISSAKLILLIMDILASVIFSYLLGAVLYQDWGAKNDAIAVGIASIFPLMILSDLLFSLVFGRRLHNFFTKRFLKKIWQSHAKDLGEQELAFLRGLKISGHPELSVPLFYSRNAYQDYKKLGPIDVELTKSLLEKNIIRKNPTDPEHYVLQRWVEDYLKLTPNALNRQ